jgi:hypothetical protein
VNPLLVGSSYDQCGYVLLTGHKFETCSTLFGMSDNQASPFVSLPTAPPRPHLISSFVFFLSVFHLS